jgi:uncharacterized protein YhbP (UPF0306 family)
MADLDDVARAILDSNSYLVLGTADPDGTPWTTPVFYAIESHRDFYWVSGPDAQHSRNIAGRAEVSIVVFDSRAPIGLGQAVYFTGVAAEVTGPDIEAGMAAYGRGCADRGARVWTEADVAPPRPNRLYRANALQSWVMEPGSSPNRRVPVSLGVAR